jgi:phosphotransferase system enzyme I (PtsP)
MFACDRGHPDLIERYDELSPPVLAFMRDMVRRCLRAGVELSICGEMASRPLEAMALIGLGVRNLSLMPADHNAVKALVRSMACGRLATFVGRLCELPDHSVRGRLWNYALDRGIQVQTPGLLLT